MKRLGYYNGKYGPLEDLADADEILMTSSRTRPAADRTE